MDWIPDRMSMALVAVPAGFFLGTHGIQGSETVETFHETFHNVRTNWPDGRMIWAAGLLAAGFTIEVDPLHVDTPSAPLEDSLNWQRFMYNHYTVAPTIIDMGLGATSQNHSAYDETITNFVISHIG
jgi:hypothetical protein